MKDFAVVGSGVGGSSIAAYLSHKGYDVVLFEKESYLGGCSSTFLHKGFKYNTGATTLAGYEDAHVVKQFLDTIRVKPKLMQSDPSIVIVQNGVEVPRFTDLEKFLTALDCLHPHPKNREFWTLVMHIGKIFYAQKGYYYSNRSIFAKTISLFSYLPFLIKCYRYFFLNAKKFILSYFEEISPAYLDFLEAQILIVAQAKSSEINFFTAALSLGYTFNKNHYVVGGFDSLFEQIASKVQEVQRDTAIDSIEKRDGYYILKSKDKEFQAKNVILNSTMYDSKRYFNDAEIKRFYDKYIKLKNTQSSFMLYMTIKSEKVFHHHYQLVESSIIKHTISKAIFVSFSDKEDISFAPQGYYSITASIHTDERFWDDKEHYKVQKEELKNHLLEIICDKLQIQEREIVQSFGATPKTFRRYINRSQLGGNPITIKNVLPFLPSNDTPIKGLYHVGDSVYPAQGWPGVMMGVNNLRKLLHV